jgi:hypothetical protein
LAFIIICQSERKFQEEREDITGSK